jgi:hypothetical protein
MIIGFKIDELTDGVIDDARAFITSVCFLLSPDIEYILANWRYVNVYSFDITQDQIDAAPFPTTTLMSGPDNTAINNLPCRLELPYIDLEGNTQNVIFGVTEYAYVEDYIRKQWRYYEKRNMIYYTGDSNSDDSNLADFAKLDFSPLDFLAG